MSSPDDKPMGSNPSAPSADGGRGTVLGGQQRPAGAVLPFGPAQPQAQTPAPRAATSGFAPQVMPAGPSPQGNPFAPQVMPAAPAQPGHGPASMGTPFAPQVMPAAPAPGNSTGGFAPQVMPAGPSAQGAPYVSPGASAGTTPTAAAAVAVPAATPFGHAQPAAAVPAPAPSSPGAPPTQPGQAGDDGQRGTVLGAQRPVGPALPFGNAGGGGYAAPPAAPPPPTGGHEIQDEETNGLASSPWNSTMSGGFNRDLLPSAMAGAPPPAAPVAKPAPAAPAAGPSRGPWIIVGLLIVIAAGGAAAVYKLSSGKGSDGQIAIPAGGSAGADDAPPEASAAATASATAAKPVYKAPVKPKSGFDDPYGDLPTKPAPHPQKPAGGGQPGKHYDPTAP